MTHVSPRIGIYGSGSIGTFIGAHCFQAGLDTVLVGREKLGQEIQAHGLRITDLKGTDFRLLPSQVRYATSASAMSDREIVLITLKSAATAQAAKELKPVLSSTAIVVSFQNGVRNAEVLRGILTQNPVLAGMVPYNVVWKPGAHFHSGTSGALAIEDQGDTSAKVLAALNAAGLAAEAKPNLQNVLWGKLVFNLNNALNALSGIPLREELGQAAYRKILASAMREAMQVMKQSGIKPARSGGLIPQIAPLVMSLPDFLFFRVASRMVKIDPQARSSMWEDLQRGRQTEIDFLNGEIVALAQRNGLQAPINAAITRLVKEAEKTKSAPTMSAAELAGRMKNEE